MVSDWCLQKVRSKTQRTSGEGDSDSDDDGSGKKKGQKGRRRKRPGEEGDDGDVSAAHINHDLLQSRYAPNRGPV